MWHSKTGWQWACVLAFVVPTTLIAKEVRPPQWSSDVLDAFFDDAREKLDGERPDFDSRGETQVAEASTELAVGEKAVVWSTLVTPETLESETKRLARSLNKSVASPSSFKGGGFKDARRDLGELAVLFAVTAQYDGNARWKDTAAGLRALFARAAQNARVGNDTTYREATQRKQDLADLIRGGRPQVPQAEATIDDWSQVAARPPLMQRLNTAHQERLLKWLADEKDFARNRDDVAHEAQIVALIANVIHRPDYEYADDDTFAEYAQQLQQAASDVAAGASTNNYQRASGAINRAVNACADCHDGYRG